MIKILILLLVIWTLVPSNVAGRTKKSVTSTVLFIAYCVGNSVGAQVFQAKDAPTYIPAIVVCSTMYGLEFVVMLAWRLYCKFFDHLLSPLQREETDFLIRCLRK